MFSSSRIALALALVSAVSVFSGAAVAAEPESDVDAEVSRPSFYQPNLFNLKGGDVSISYSTSGFDGRPHFNYSEGSTHKHFTADEIKTDETSIGTLVTVTTRNLPDAGWATVSVLIPHVNLDHSAGQYSAPIATEVVVTWHKESMLREGNSGQTQTYKFIKVNGTARSVLF